MGKGYGFAELRAKIPWARVLAEGVVIVVSILLAFWIDTRWDGRQDRAQREALLNALLEDFETAEVLLENVETRHRALAEADRRLVLFGEDGSVPDTERGAVDSLLAHHFSRPVFQPPMGTVESILGTGRLDLFKSEALLASLTKWTASVAGLQQAEEDVRQHFYTRIYPYLASRIDIEDLDKGFAKYLRQPFPFPQEETSAYLLVTDLELQNMLYTHWVLNMNILEFSIPLVQATLKDMRAQAEAELRR
jgi:hypothetical protein